MRFRINAARMIGGKTHVVTRMVVDSDEAPELERSNRVFPAAGTGMARPVIQGIPLAGPR